MTRFALILGLLLCLTVPAAGQKGDLQRQIAEKQRAIDALEKQIARGEQELTSIKKGKNSEQQSVRRLSRGWTRPSAPFLPVTIPPARTACSRRENSGG